MAKTNANSVTATSAGIMKAIDKLGSDCSGSSAAANRVLTLSNVKLTTGFIIFINGTALHPTHDYTASNLSASSTITFINPVWDTDYIDGYYLI